MFNPWRFYQQHLECLILPFQPILTDRKQLENIRRHAYRWHYLIASSLPLCICLDILINWYTFDHLDYRQRGYYHIVLMKQFMPDEFLQDSWLTCAGIYAFELIPHLFGILETNPHIEFILLYENGLLMYPYRNPAFQLVSSKLSDKLTKFWNQYRKQNRRMREFLAFELDLAFFYPLGIIELYKIYESDFQYMPSLRIIIILVACPFVDRIAVSSINTGIQFICQNYIIHIKQRHYLDSMNKAAKLDRGVQSVKKGYFLWRQKIGQILDITREIIAMNKFYSKYVTVSMMLCAHMGCTILNTAIKRGRGLMQVLIWYIFGCLYLANLWMFSAFSSRTIYLNVQLFKSLRRFQIQLLSRSYLTVTQIVKLDLVNEYKIFLRKCSFTMLDFSMINNKLFFFSLFVSVTVFWMKLETPNSLFYRK